MLVLGSNVRAGFAFCNHLGDTVAMKYFIRRLVAPIRKLAGFIRHQHQIREYGLLRFLVARASVQLQDSESAMRSF